MAHPVPFMKASNVVAPKKTAKEMPDLEDAIEADDDEAEVVEPVEDDEVDLKKDKYIKQPKAKPKKAAKKKAADEDDGEGDEAAVKPAKGRGKGKAAAKSKGKK